MPAAAVGRQAGRLRQDVACGLPLITLFVPPPKKQNNKTKHAHTRGRHRLQVQHDGGQESHPQGMEWYTYHRCV